MTQSLWNLAQQQADNKEYAKAEMTLQRIKKITRDKAEVLFFLGEMNTHQNKWPQASVFYQQSIKAAPAAYPARHALARLYRQQQDYHAAFECLLPILNTESSTLGFTVQLIKQVLQSGAGEVAANYCQQALKLLPKSFELYFLLGDIYRIYGGYDRAIQAYQYAIQCNPKCTQAMNNLAVVYQNQGFLSHAEQYFLRALSIEPENIDFMVNLAGVYMGQKKLADSVDFLRGKLKKFPDSSPLKGCLARVLQEMGLHDEALGYFQASLAHFEAQAASKLEYSQYHGSYLSFLNYPSHLSKAYLYQAHLAWAHQHAPQAECLPPHYEWVYAPDQSESEGVHRRLRVGYVSADLRQHSVAYFLLPLLRQHNKQKVSVYCYMNHFHKDNMTAELQHYSDHWRTTAEQSTAQLAAQIHDDQIDVLIDLSGHTAGNRLDVFALKPAPVQATWLGYPNTTGLSMMDYRFTDAWADPAGEENWHSEQLRRLPHGFLCYQPPCDAPDVSPLPLGREKIVTYGSFNNLAKHNTHVIALWSRLLTANKSSRLLIKNKSLSDPQTARTVRQRFAKHGVAAEQLELIGYLPEQKAHLDLYGRIDIALDTFPYNGTTTTCEALWMGVPVITLAGDRHAGRVGVSLLNQIGHPEWVAENEEAYIKKALALAHNPHVLDGIRQGLRSRMQHSPLADAAMFAQAFESVLTSVCQERPRKH